MPAAAFVWRVQNNSSQPKHVSITFTFKNGTGGRNSGRKCTSETFRVEQEADNIIGVALEQKIDDLDVTYGIGCLQRVRGFVLP